MGLPGQLLGPLLWQPMVLYEDCRDRVPVCFVAYVIKPTRLAVVTIVPSCTAPPCACVVSCGDNASREDGEPLKVYQSLSLVVILFKKKNMIFKNMLFE